MEVFELIKSVLDTEFGSIPGTTAQKVKAIQKSFKVMTHAYEDLTDPNRPPPDYTDPATRFAYIYKYTTCHAGIVEAMLNRSAETKAMFRNPGRKVIASIGGGPGSDFVGILKRMRLNGNSCDIKWFLLDAEAGWGDTWADIEEHTSKLGFDVSTHSQTLDVTIPATWVSQKKYLSADLFTLIYFVSEVYRTQHRALPFFDHLATSAKSGAIFLYVDNNTDCFSDLIDKWASRHSLVTLVKGNECYNLPSGEEKTSLEPYLTTLSHVPKIRTWVAFRIFRKP